MLNQVTSWQSIVEYVAAGNLVAIAYDNNLMDLSLTVIYGALREQEMCEITFNISCIDCAYIEIKRSKQHLGGSSAILEAYLHEHSQLIDDILAHKKEARVGPLLFEYEQVPTPIQHIEIIGEISLNIICERIETTVTSGQL